MLGDDADSEVQDALAGCHFGLLLISLAFLNSEYISKYELPSLLETNRALPIGFNQFKLDSHDLKGLQEKQIFRSETDRFYDRCAGNAKKDFIERLYEQIESKLDKLACLALEHHLTHNSYQPT